MKRWSENWMVLTVFVCLLAACHPGTSQNVQTTDTAGKSHANTDGQQVITGNPGPTGLDSTTIDSTHTKKDSL